MKKLILSSALFLFIVTGCKMPVYTLGMTEAQFKTQNKWYATLVEASAKRTVYRIPDSSLQGQPQTYMYYYFVNGKLTRIDQGAPKPDVIIEHIGK